MAFHIVRAQPCMQAICSATLRKRLMLSLGASSKANMTTYLFAWNPARWKWTYLQESIAAVEQNGFCNEPWGCGVTKKILPGDRAFLMKLGNGRRGIVASGWVTSNVYEGRHWDKDQKAQGKIARYVDIDWDTLLNPDTDIFPRQWLESKIYSNMHWEPQASGVSIPDNIAEQLEKDWAKFLNRPAIIMETPLAEEIDATRTYTEGATRQIRVNVYERSAEARAICINRYGLNCAVCGFNFEKTYGAIGEGFIHVHHLKPLAEIGRGYRLSPIRDLRPVCPNCHAMLHKKKPAYSIEELKVILKRKAH